MERDQTIVTLETEVSEVTYKKPTNIRCLCGSQLQLMLESIPPSFEVGELTIVSR